MTPSIPKDEIHIWLVPLSPPFTDMHTGEEILDTQEKLRAHRLRIPCVAERFIAAHAAMRLILSAYTGVSPETIRYLYSPQGKPHLAMPQSELHFNMSHSESLAAIALANAPVGVDIEKIDWKIPFQDIADRYFSAAENEAINSLHTNERLTAFYNCWTRKEAYIKAHGGGFTLPSDCFDVSTSSSGHPRLLRHRIDPAETDRWQIRDLSLPDGFRGAIATRLQTPVTCTFSGSWGVPPLASKPT